MKPDARDHVDLALSNGAHSCRVPLNCSILFLFGSQTGAAKSIAESLHTTALAKGIPAVLAPLNDYNKVDLQDTPIAIIVCSTTGNGDPPNNAEEFWRYIRKRTHPKDLFANLKYAVLGLGDTNYDKFCAAAKGIIKRFGELSATPFYAPTYADEAVGLESVVDPWTTALWPALEATIASVQREELGAAASSVPEPVSHVPDTAIVGAPAHSAAPVPPTLPAAPLTSDAGAARGAVGGQNGGSAGPGHAGSSNQTRAGDDAAAALPLSPMAQMRAMKALQAEQRQHAETERRRSRQNSMDAALDAGGAGAGAGQGMGLGDVGAGVSVLRGDTPPVDATDATDSVLHLHTQGIRSSWSGKDDASASASASASAPGSVGGGAVSASGGGAAGGRNGVAAGTDGRLTQESADITMDTRGMHVDDIVEAAARAAAAAVSAQMNNKRGRSGSTSTASEGTGGAAANGGTSASSTAGLRIEAPMRPALSAQDLAGLGGVGGEGGQAADLAPLPSIPLLPTPGVRSVRELFPHLVHHNEGARAGVARPENIIPPAAVSASAKLFPSRPPLTVSVKVLSTAEAAALTAAQALMSSPGFLPSPPSSGAVVGLMGMGVGSEIGKGMSSATTPPGRATSSTKDSREGATTTMTTATTTVQPTCSTGTSSPPGRSLDHPIVLPITGARYLTTGGRESDRRVVHLQLGVDNTPLASTAAGTITTSTTPTTTPTWSPGDAVGIIVPNDQDEVEAICRRVGVHPGLRVQVQSLASSTPGPAAGLKSAASGTSLHTPVASPFPASAVPPALATHGSSEVVVGMSGSPISARPGAGSLPIHFPAWLPGYPYPTLRDVLTWCVDIRTSPKKSFLRLLAESCPSGSSDGDVLMWLAGRAGKEAAKVVVEDQRLSLVDLLALFPSCTPSLDSLLSALPALSPRYYSLTCSPLADPHALTFAFTVVQYEVQPSVGVVASALPLETPAPGRGSDGSGSSATTPPPGPPIARKGLATGYLERCAQAWLDPVHAHTHVHGKPAAAAPCVRAFLRPGKDFFPPASLSTPMIMIGPGTGVAPFVGFLQHRAAKRAQHAAAATVTCTGSWRGAWINSLREDKEQWQPHTLGPAWLFFGNRRADMDFLYREELSGYLGEGTLTRLVTAWSRETPGQKVYVQHKLGEPEIGRAVADLILAKGAHVYVCGDGGAMARDVHDALVATLNKYAGEFGGFKGQGKGAGAGVQPTGPAPTTPTVSSTASSSSLSLADVSHGAELLADMAKRGKYVRDIWS